LPGAGTGAFGPESGLATMGMATPYGETEALTERTPAIRAELLVRVREGQLASRLGPQRNDRLGTVRVAPTHVDDTVPHLV